MEDMQTANIQSKPSIALYGEDIPVSLLWTDNALGLPKAKVQAVMQALGIKPSRKATDAEEYISLDDLSDLEAYFNALKTPTDEEGKHIPMLERPKRAEMIVQLLREHRETRKQKPIDTSSTLPMLRDRLEEGSLDLDDWDEEDGIPVLRESSPEAIASHVQQTIKIIDSVATAIAEKLQPPIDVTKKYRDLSYFAENDYWIKTLDLKSILGSRPVHNKVYFGTFRVLMTDEKDGKARLWRVEIV